MWNAPDGFFQLLFTFALIGGAAVLGVSVWLVYVLATNITLVWGAA